MHLSASIPPPPPPSENPGYTPVTNAPFFLLFTDSSDYQDMEFRVFLFNSSQHTLNISIPIINVSPTEALQVSLRLLSDDFSCATIEPSTADIHILEDDIDNEENGGG